MGGIITGYISDKIKKRAIVMFPMLLIASFICFCIKYFLSNQALPYYPMIFLVGIFMGGPYGLISSVVSIDLAQQPVLRDRPSIQIALSGLIEGTGSLGAGKYLLFSLSIGIYRLHSV